MSKKLDDTSGFIERALGSGGQVDLVPVLIPMQTYQLLLALGMENGISPADVLAQSILLYAKPKQDIQEPGKKITEAKRVDFVYKKRNRQ